MQSEFNNENVNFSIEILEHFCSTLETAVAKRCRYHWFNATTVQHLHVHLYVLRPRNTCLTNAYNIVCSVFLRRSTRTFHVKSPNVRMKFNSWIICSMISVDGWLFMTVLLQTPPPFHSEPIDYSTWDANSKLIIHVTRSHHIASHRALHSTKTHEAMPWGCGC